MSTYGLQKAIALLIRLPEANRGTELEGFLKGYDLNEHEKSQARAIADNFELVKFGKIMGSVRERKVTRLLKMSETYLTESLLRSLWEKHFEPSATKVSFNQLPEAFLSFLVEDDSAKRLLAEEAPPFISDMLRFELAQARFRMKHFKHVKKVPERSTLKHADFVTLSVDYDIQALRARILRESPEPGTLAPEKRRVRLLFLKKPDTFDCRIFEIDEETKSYLEGQLETPVRKAPRPDSYGSLIQLGLCQEIQ